MHTGAFEAVRTAHPLAQNIADGGVIFHDGNGDVHGFYFSPNALGKIVVSFPDARPDKFAL
jgi:hypothetical protein